MSHAMENDLNVEQVENEAAAWILKRESPAWSADDDARLNLWLKASTNHRVAYVRLRSVWSEADRLKIVNAGSARGKVPPRGAIAQSPFFLGKRRPGLERTNDANIKAPASSAPYKIYSLAASIALIICAGIAAYLWPGGAPTYRTPVGGLATVPMDDGSKITLNTDSEITLQITDKERRVNLRRGEAFFDVAKDANRPFVVHADDQRVIAVGTKFAVRLKSESVQVAVTEGLVRMEERASSNSGAGRVSSPLLTPGTVASAKDRRVSIRQEPVANVEQILSWRTGYVVLQKALLSDAVSEFNRYNRRQLVIDDPALADVVVGGNFRSDNLDGFVRLLQEGFKIRAHETDHRIVLTRK